MTKSEHPVYGEFSLRHVRPKQSGSAHSAAAI
jgi:hypothetical protein